MRFEELRIRGFLSFGDKEQVVKLGKRGLVLIEGENRDDPTVDNNGSGKSTISEALLWALFGQTVRGVSGDAVVNRHANNGCKVTLTFTNDAGETFKVERHRKDAKEKNRLAFTGPTGGLTANESSVTEAKIVEAIGMDFDTFTASVIFGQGQTKHFAAMTDKEMKRVTDKLIGVEMLSDAHKRASDDLKDAQRRLAEVRSKEVDMDDLRAVLKQVSEDAAEWDEEHKAKLDEYDREIAEANAPDTTALEAEVKRLEVRARAKSVTYDHALRKATSAQSDVSVARAAVNACEKALKEAAQSTGACGHCGQVVTGASLAAHQQKLNEERAKAARALGDALNTFDKLNAEKVMASEASDKAEKELKKADRVLAEAKAEAGKAATITKVRDAYAKQTNPHMKAIARAEEAVRKGAETNAAIEAKAEAFKREVEQLTFIASMFSDKGGPGMPPLKGLLVESVAPFVNNKLAHYSRILTEGNIGITFETQSQLKTGEYRDTYALKAVNRNGADAYAGASGGEKRKIDAAIFFAFQALAASRSKEQVRFAVWDEVFDALDETAQEVMMELLLDENRSKDTMFVITQRPELRSSFPSTLKVVKAKGVSSIV